MKLVFFDVDNTLVKGHTGLMMAMHLYRKGVITSYHIFRGILYTILHKINRMDYQEMISGALKLFEGWEEKELIRLAEDCFEKRIKRRIFIEGIAVVKYHQERGDSVVLLSSGIKYFIDKLGRYLNVEHCIATDVEFSRGKLTTHLSLPVCYGEGKKILAERFAMERGFSLKDAYFYSDSSSDIPLLNAVAYPVVVNPDMFLKKTATTKGWEIRYFKKVLGEEHL